MYPPVGCISVLLSDLLSSPPTQSENKWRLFKTHLLRCLFFKRNRSWWNGSCGLGGWGTEQPSVTRVTDITGVRILREVRSSRYFQSLVLVSVSFVDFALKRWTTVANLQPNLAPSILVRHRSPTTTMLLSRSLNTETSRVVPNTSLYGGAFLWLHRYRCHSTHLTIICIYFPYKITGLLFDVSTREKNMTVAARGNHI